MFFCSECHNVTLSDGQFFPNYCIALIQKYNTQNMTSVTGNTVWSHCRTPKIYILTRLFFLDWRNVKHNKIYIRTVYIFSITKYGVVRVLEVLSTWRCGTFTSSTLWVSIYLSSYQSKIISQWRSFLNPRWDVHSTETTKYRWRLKNSVYH